MYGKYLILFSTQLIYNSALARTMIFLIKNFSPKGPNYIIRLGQPFKKCGLQNALRESQHLGKISGGVLAYELEQIITFCEGRWNEGGKKCYPERQLQIIILWFQEQESQKHIWTDCVNHTAFLSFSLFSTQIREAGMPNPVIPAQKQCGHFVRKIVPSSFFFFLHLHLSRNKHTPPEEQCSTHIISFSLFFLNVFIQCNTLTLNW